MQTNDSQTLVLCALADGPKHGYAINSAIEQLTGQRLGAGSLYGALSRLEAKGLLVSEPSDGRQQPVRITNSGRAALEEQLRAMARVSRLGLASLGVQP
jgi:DNA-binding PadR family transcriptional regulator